MVQLNKAFWNDEQIWDAFKDVPGPGGRTRLMYVSVKGYEKRADWLLKRGSRINTGRYEDGSTALHLCCYSKKMSMAKFLLNHGARVNIARTSTGTTALILACQKGHLGLVKLLVDDWGADVQARKTSDGTTPLHLAAHLGDVPMATLLLDKGADVNASKKHRGVTPLHLAAEKGHLEMVRLLIARGGNVDAMGTTPEGGGHSVLMEACLNSHAPIVALLIEAGVDVDAQTQTPGAIRALNWAINVENLACVQLLLGPGKADVNFRFGPHLDRSPLTTTASPTIAALLCDAGADVNLSSPTTGYTPLCTAVEEGNVPLTKLLLERGASVHHRTGAGLTPLLLAATTNFSLLRSDRGSSGSGGGGNASGGSVSSIVRMLVERGADVNAAIPRCGTTPLMGACANGDTGTARYLLRHGADRALFNANGLDALAQIHKKLNTDALVTLLKH